MKIVIADTLEIFIEGLRTVIHSIGDTSEIVECRNYSHLLSNLHDNVDLIILEHCNEFKAISLLKSQIIDLKTKIIVVSSNNNKRDLKEFLHLGVYGYLLKSSTKIALKQTVESVLKNEKYFCPFVMDTLLNKQEQDNDIANLTEREIEITRLISVGLKNKEIADRLSVSPHTVHTHRKNILRKTGVSSALELSIYAKANGIS